MTIKQVSSPTNKKIEGFDKTTLSSTFTSKIDKLKNKPKTEVLEDQYIKGLQDEIKYLEMQLKLLQEKDQEKHGQIDQLQRVFLSLLSFLETAYPSMKTSSLLKTALITTNQSMKRRSTNQVSKSRKESLLSMGQDKKWSSCYQNSTRVRQIIVP